MRAAHFWTWCALSALWMGLTAALLDLPGSLERIRQAEAHAPAAAIRPDATDFYRPAQAVRDRAVDWQRSEVTRWTLDREYAALRQVVLVAVAPPLVALVGLYVYTLIATGARGHGAARNPGRRIEYDQLRAWGYAERRVIDRIPKARRRGLLRWLIGPPRV